MKTPEHLKINGRAVDNDFLDSDCLYRSFKLNDFDNFEGSIKIAHITSPEYSCNWSRYSRPEDVKHRKNSNCSEGCYSLTVEVVKFGETAKPIHDPVEEADYENYAHVDVRWLKKDEGMDAMPEAGRRYPKSKKLKMEYRNHIVNNLKILFKPTG